MNEQLISAVSKGDLAKVIEVVNKGAANVNTRDKHQWTPLMIATLIYSVDIVQYLCSLRETDINAVDNDGNTALDMATIDLDDQIALILCQRGALVNKVNLDWVNIAYHPLMLQQQARSVIFALMTVKIKRLGKDSTIKIMKESGLYRQLAKMLNI